MTRRRPLLTLVGAAALTVLAQHALPADAAKKPLQIHLTPQNGSGETGTATMLDGVDGLIIKLRMSEDVVVQPAHIHKGTCANLDPKPAYPLPPVTAGTSQTTIANLTTTDLLAHPYAINVHKSGPMASIYVSCVDIVAAAPSMPK